MKEYFELIHALKEKIKLKTFTINDYSLILNEYKKYKKKVLS